ncbi:MAG: hypothetical protein ABI538_04605 [Pseudoxanthomonas sp.]
MSKSSRQINRSARLMTETASASAEVIAARMTRLGDPGEFMSARQQRDINGMVSEKLAAGMQGWVGAMAETWMLPSRAMATLGRPSLFTPAGAARAAGDIGALWLAVGDAALRPAKRKASSNRTRLRKAGK